MIVGGSEAKVHPLSLSRFNLFAQYSKRNDDPEGASARSTATATAPHPARNGGVHLEARVGGSPEGEGVRGGVLGGERGGPHLSGSGLTRVIRNALASAGINPPTSIT